jgi:mono/diheme cytochrome c family protein
MTDYSNLSRLFFVLALSWPLPGLISTDATGASGRETQRGKAIYEQRCVTCHGPYGKGDGPDAPFLSPRPASLISAGTSAKSDGELLEIIAKGKPRTAMPGWKDTLTEDELQDVLAYIRSLIHFQQSLTPPPPSADVNRQ